MKKIIAINGSPRQGWNTDLCVREAAKGAADAGAEVEIIDLYKINPIGCRSCFACKTDKNLGKCVYPDELAPVLEKIRNADGLILGSPIYLGEITAGLRALFERMVFQRVAYRADKLYHGKDKELPVLLVITSNAPLFTFEDEGYAQMIERYQREFTKAFGPTNVVIADETMQVNDYEKYNWTRFDYADRRRRRKEVFPKQLEEAYQKGKELACE